MSDETKPTEPTVELELGVLGGCMSNLEQLTEAARLRVLWYLVGKYAGHGPAAAIDALIRKGAPPAPRLPQSVPVTGETQQDRRRMYNSQVARAIEKFIDQLTWPSGNSAARSKVRATLVRVVDEAAGGVSCGYHEEPPVDAADAIQRIHGVDLVAAARTMSGRFQEGFKPAKYFAAFLAANEEEKS